MRPFCPSSHIRWQYITEDCSGMEDRLSRLNDSFLKLFFCTTPFYVNFSYNKLSIFDLKFFWKYKFFAKFFILYFWFKNCCTCIKFSPNFISHFYLNFFPGILGDRLSPCGGFLKLFFCTMPFIISIFHVTNLILFLYFWLRKFLKI